MKMQRRWVTGIAALLLTVGLMGLPREGTAFAIRFVDPGGDPQFGDPTEPYGAVEIRPDLFWLGGARIQFWFSVGAAPRFIVYPLKPRATPLGAKTGNHERRSR